MKQSQEEFVINELKQNGFISRNYCLRLYELGVRTSITRLASIISALNESGWEISGSWEKKNTGKDFVYRVVGMPFEKVAYKVDLGGGEFKEIIKFKAKVV